MILGGAAAVYYILLVSYAGMLASFSLFWLFAAIAFWASGLLYSIRDKFGRFLEPFLFPKVFLITTICLFMVIFLLVEGIVISHMSDDAGDTTCDYLIVLGCQVRKDHMPRSLKYRLDKTLEYCREHEDTIAIVSGGMGENEDITEAVAMRNYLIESGMDASRIRMERFATDTRQNLKLSYMMIPNKEKTQIGIVSNGFHIYRALKLAEGISMKNVHGIAAPSDILMLPNNLVREFFALTKEKFAGHF